MFKTRFKNEVELLNQKKYRFILNDSIIKIFTNHGILEIELPSSYPFSHPKVHIYSNLLELEDKKTNKFLYLNKLFSKDIIDKINIYLYPKKDKIHIKKYFYQNLGNSDVIFDFDNILHNWSPARKIINILEFLESLNDKYKIKNEKKFNILRNDL